MVVLVLISLYTSRLVLQALGVEDFGVYNAVGGFVSMFSLLSTALNNAISRYITFELGKGDSEKLRTVFSSAVSVQMLMAVVVVVVSEAIGVWFLNARMNIPSDRLYAANWVFQCSLFTFAVSLINVPYNACIIAHERMTVFAYIGVVEALMRLGAVALLFVIGYDSLIAYSILIMLVSIVARIIYGMYCSRNFEEARYSFIMDKGLVKEMASFASWNMLGSSSTILNSYGVNLLMNLFFGVSANAARGVATQVYNAVTNFVHNFTTAVNPQITKSYASGDLKYSISLAMMSSRYSFYLMLFVVAPLCLETPKILDIWLVEVPGYAVTFVRLTLLMSIISTLSVSLFTLSMATGDIKRYQIVIGSLSLSSFFWVYVAYKLGMPVETSYYINIMINILILFARIKILSDQVGLSKLEYVKKVVLRALAVGAVVAAALYCFKAFFSIEGIVGFIVSLLVSEVVTVLTVYFLGLSAGERKEIVSKCVEFYKNKIA